MKARKTVAWQRRACQQSVAAWFSIRLYATACNLQHRRRMCACNLWPGMILYVAIRSGPYPVARQKHAHLQLMAWHAAIWGLGLGGVEGAGMPSTV